MNKGLPDFNKVFEYENNFYLSCNDQRMGKFIAHYELFKMTKDLQGSIVECGVFKGVSLTRFAHFRKLFGGNHSKKIIGFDIFGKFPETNFEDDKKKRKKFMYEAGEYSISKKELMNICINKCIDNYELIEGDICKTVPDYLKNNPQLKISLLNLDTDIYEPCVTILENLWDKIVKGGILILDDYGVFAGETKAVDEFFKDKNITIHKFDFSSTPSYIIKQ